MTEAKYYVVKYSDPRGEEHMVCFCEDDETRVMDHATAAMGEGCRLLNVHECGSFLEAMKALRICWLS